MIETGFQRSEKVSKDQGLPRMPGRLRARINVWRQTTSDSFVLSVIAGGYKISWNKYGAPPPREQSNSPNCANHVEFIDSSIKDALAMGVVCETSRENLNNISPLNVDVKKSNGKRRLIFNAMFINMFMNVPKFKYPQLYREGKEIFSGSKYGYVLDISQAFYHIEIHPQFYRYLGFMWKDKYYYWRCCPFGVSFGPWLWDRILTPVVDKLKKEGLQIMAFCDDVMGSDEEKSQADEDGLRLKVTLQIHGYICQDEKCKGIGDSLPTITGLGMIIDLQEQKYFMTEKRQHQIIDMCQQALSHPFQQARLIARIAGIIMSQISAIGPMARIRTRFMYACIQSRRLSGENCSEAESYDLLVFVDEDTKKELQYWISNTKKVNGREISTRIVELSYHCLTSSDASSTGYGGFLQIPLESTRMKANMLLKNIQDLRINVTVNQAQQGLDVWGSFSLEQSMRSSTWRELYGTGKLFETFGPILSGITVPVYLDSQVSVMVLGGSLPTYPNKVFGGSKKEDLQQLVSWIFDLAEKYDFGIHPLWVPRTLNERSDYNSHLNEHNHYDYCLKLEVFQQVESLFGPHTIDRFASDTSAQLIRYNTQYFSPHAEGLDAFTMNWGMGDNNYVFPPPLMVGRAIQHAQRCRATITLIYMEWYSRPYMNMLFPRHKNKHLVSWHRLGRSHEILEYRSPDSIRRGIHLPKGEVCVARLKFN